MEATKRDPLETQVSTFAPTPGQGAFELAVRASGPGLRRTLGMSIQTRQVKGPGPETVLCPGAAVGLCSDGRVRHVRPYHAPQQFAGFHYRTVDPERILVQCRGNARLRIQGAETATVGMPVYAEDVDSFTVTPTSEHAVLMGEIKVVEQGSGFALVAFKGFDDQRQ
jgi:hypothetical protein